MKTPEWMEQALCAQTGDPEDWFPGKGASAREARKICGRCPSQHACLTYALTDEDTLQGVWGGTTERERRDLRRKRGLGGTERTHCRNQHPYTDENTRHDARGYRECVTCKREADRRAVRGAVA